MDELSWQKVVVIVTALLCATIVECLAISQGLNGYLLAGYLGIIGSVVGVPVGMFIQDKRK